jgi:hypothetical protein
MALNGSPVSEGGAANGMLVIDQPLETASGFSSCANLTFGLVAATVAGGGVTLFAFASNAAGTQRPFTLRCSPMGQAFPQI